MFTVVYCNFLCRILCILYISLTNWTYDQNFTLYFKINDCMLNCALIIKKNFKQLVCINIFYLEKKNVFMWTKNPNRTDSGTIGSCSISFQGEHFMLIHLHTVCWCDLSILKCSAIIFWNLWIYLLRNRFQCCDFVIMALNTVGQPCKSMFR